MKRYIMTTKQYRKLMDAMQPVPAIALQCGPLVSPQERANAAWSDLGSELGFNPMTVRPAPGCPETVFEAEPTR